MPTSRLVVAAETRRETDGRRVRGTRWWLKRARVSGRVTPYSQNIQTSAKLFDNLALATSRSRNLERDDYSMASILRRQRLHWLAGAHSGRGIEAAATSKMLRSVAIVVPQQTAKSFTAFDFATMLANFFTRLDDRVPQALMISLAVIMRQEFMASFSQRFLTKEYHSIETLGSQRSEKPLDESVQVWTSRWQDDRFHARLPEHLAKRWTESTVAIHDEIFLVVEKTIFTVGQFTSLLFHPRFLGVRRAIDELDATRFQIHDEQSESAK